MSIFVTCLHLNSISPPSPIVLFHHDIGRSSPSSYSRSGWPLPMPLCPPSSWSQASQQDPQTRCCRRKLMVRFVVCSCVICCPHTVHLKIPPPSILTGPTITVGDEYHRLNSGTMPKFIVLLLQKHGDREVSLCLLFFHLLPKRVSHLIFSLSRLTATTIESR